MSDDLFDKIHDLVYPKILHLGDTQTDDTAEARECMSILSNMLEYIDYDITLNNMTGSWKLPNNETDLDKVNRVFDNLNRTLKLIQMVRNVTLKKLSFLQPTI